MKPARGLIPLTDLAYRDYAAKLPDKVILVRSSIGTAHRQIAAKWMCRAGNPDGARIVCPVSLTRVWEELMPNAEVVSKERMGRDSQAISRDLCVIEQPSLNAYTRQFDSLLQVTAEARCCLVLILAPVSLNHAAGVRTLAMKNDLEIVVL